MVGMVRAASVSHMDARRDEIQAFQTRPGTLRKNKVILQPLFRHARSSQLSESPDAGQMTSRRERVSNVSR